ncbi:STAS domain-containing protein [Treponema sp. OttesenSCG-928-L16]|nr:STAS domain-containing protein [Treponema sp. OttesenSCG-928-L16]
MADFEIIEHRLTAYTLFEVTGEIHANNHQDFYRPLRREVFRRDIVLDLSRVSNISSSGIGALISLVENGQEAQRQVFILKPSEIVQMMLDSSGCSDCFVVIQELKDIAGKER